jgi:predicted transposase YbfD/YdcC
MFVYDGCDALPKKTLKTAKETSNEVIVQVKENQKHLLNSCEQVGREEAVIDRHVSRTKGRGRKETRTVEVFDQIKKWPTSVKRQWEKYVAAIIRVERIRKKFDTRLKKWSRSSEISYYLSTVLLSAQEYNKAIREHWWIENKNHYVRDVSMHEDKSRIRVNPDRFVKLRSIALNVMRANGEENIKQALYKNGLSVEQLLHCYDYLL